MMWECFHCFQISMMQSCLQPNTEFIVKGTYTEFIVVGTHTKFIAKGTHTEIGVCTVVLCFRALEYIGLNSNR